MDKVEAWIGIPGEDLSHDRRLHWVEPNTVWVARLLGIQNVSVRRDRPGAAADHAALDAHTYAPAGPGCPMTIRFPKRRSRPSNMPLATLAALVP